MKVDQIVHKKTTNPTLSKSLRNIESNAIDRPQTESLRHYLHAATSENTRKAYRSAIRQFEKWGGRLPTQRDVVISYLLAKAESLNPRTLDLHLTAISQWHIYQGISDPVGDPMVRKTMEGIRRTHGRPKQKAKALRLEHIAQMVKYLGQQKDTKKKKRDLALVLTGFFGAFRRSELVAIQVSHLIWEPEGLIVHLPRSKTDQKASGLVRALPFAEKQSCCPVSAIKIWMETAGIAGGPLFRPVNRWDHVQEKHLNPAVINDLLKSLGRGCNFSFLPELSSHSFRRGLSTSAGREKIDFELIKKQGGWTSDATVWGYIEEGQLLTENASGLLMQKMAELMETL